MENGSHDVSLGSAYRYVLQHGRIYASSQTMTTTRSWETVSCCRIGTISSTPPSSAHSVFSRTNWTTMQCHSSDSPWQISKQAISKVSLVFKIRIFFEIDIHVYAMFLFKPQLNKFHQTFNSLCHGLMYCRLLID